MSAPARITFFVDPAWKKDGMSHIPLLFPFWGNSVTQNSPFHYALFEKYSFDTACYGITSDPTKADMVLMPYSHNIALAKYPELMEECAKRAQEMGKLLLIDGVGDIEHPIAIPHAVILRYGGYRFKKDSRELHIPPYADDLLERYCGGELAVRLKTPKPVVGFAGWTQIKSTQLFKTLIKELPVRLWSLVDSRYGAYKKGIFFRRRAIAALRSSGLVAANIIERNSYSAHIKTAADATDTLRKEFVENILASDYCLDVRGDANNSTRLFEILSLGRIPVIVDTERNLPFAEQVDYRAFSLLVDFRDIGALPERIAALHQRLSPEQFAQMQTKAREAYLYHFRIDALMPHLVADLSRRIHLHD